VYGAPAGSGGLGLQAATALTALAGRGVTVHAFGPGRLSDWPLQVGEPPLVWHRSPKSLTYRALRYSWWRWYQGHYQLLRDRSLGRWAKRVIERLSPECCYVFTQVGLETLKWARKNEIPTVLDNPTGHIRHYGEVFARETREWSGSKHLGHPTNAMIERVEEEYYLADRIRVSSEWAKRSLISYGVQAKKIQVVPQPLNLSRFRPGPTRVCGTGPLQVCYVGSLNLAKGFQYLTRAIKRLAPDAVDLEIVGATGTRIARQVFQKERQGINVTAVPGDPLVAYQRAEIFVLPSLHDGFGFVVGEAMACGLPVIVTESCGASGWVRNGTTGWIVPPGRDDALAGALIEALHRRAQLNAMGQLARADVEKLGNLECLGQLREWVYSNQFGPEELNVETNGSVNVI